MKNQTPAHRSEKGQSLVELAVMVVVVFILLAGAVDLGRAFLSYMTLREAASEGVMYGSIAPTDLAGIEGRVRASSRFPVDMTDTEQVQVQISTTPNACVGSFIEVQARYRFRIATPFLGALIGSQEVPITSRSTGAILSSNCSN